MHLNEVISPSHPIFSARNTLLKPTNQQAYKHIDCNVGPSI